MGIVKPKLGFRLVRIEAGAESVDESDLVWMAWIVDVDVDVDDPDTAVMGYLRAAGPNGFGQARSVAYISGRNASTEATPGDLEQWIRENVLEQLYDLGRRALNSQAAAMDFTLDLPSKAPEIELDYLGASSG